MSFWFSLSVSLSISFYLFLFRFSILVESYSFSRGNDFVGCGGMGGARPFSNVIYSSSSKKYIYKKRKKQKQERKKNIYIDIYFSLYFFQIQFGMCPTGIGLWQMSQSPIFSQMRSKYRSNCGRQFWTLQRRSDPAAIYMCVYIYIYIYIFRLYRRFKSWRREMCKEGAGPQIGNVDWETEPGCGLCEMKWLRLLLCCRCWIFPHDVDCVSSRVCKPPEMIHRVMKRKRSLILDVVLSWI